MEYEIIPHEDFVAQMKKPVPGEALTPTQKRIRHLRGVFVARHLTVPQVSEMINDKVASSTLYRFFSEDSELNYTFTTYTIDVIQLALLVGDTMDIGDATAKEKVASYEAALQEKDDVIADLRHQLEHWQQQIIKKDERMDRKDRIIEQQDKEIHELRARLDKYLQEPQE